MNLLIFKLERVLLKLLHFITFFFYTVTFGSWMIGAFLLLVYFLLEIFFFFTFFFFFYFLLLELLKLLRLNWYFLFFLAWICCSKSSQTLTISFWFFTDAVCCFDICEFVFWSASLMKFRKLLFLFNRELVDILLSLLRVLPCCFRPFSFFLTFLVSFSFLSIVDFLKYFAFKDRRVNMFEISLKRHNLSSSLCIIPWRIFLVFFLFWILLHLKLLTLLFILALFFFSDLVEIFLSWVFLYFTCFFEKFAFVELGLIV